MKISDRISDDYKKTVFHIKGFRNVEKAMGKLGIYTELRILRSVNEITDIDNAEVTLVIRLHHHPDDVDRIVETSQEIWSDSLKQLWRVNVEPGVNMRDIVRFLIREQDGPLSKDWVHLELDQADLTAYCGYVGPTRIERYQLKYAPISWAQQIDPAEKPFAEFSEGFRKALKG